MRTNARPAALALACLGASLALASLSAAQGHPVPAGAEPPSSVRLRFPGGAPFVELPFDLVANKILLDVTLNGAGPLRFVLDSGAPTTVVLRPSRLEGVALDYHGQAHVAGAGDEAVAARPARLARGVSLGLAGLQLEGVGLVVLPELGHDEVDALPWDGILGGPVFSRLVVELDWQRRRLRFHDPASYRPPDGAAALPLDIRGGHAFVDCDVTIDGASRPLRLVVDTGASHALALRRGPVPLPRRRLAAATLGRGLSGMIRGDVARVDELRCGGAALRDVVTGFPEASAVRVAVGADGNLGTEALRRFGVTFDYPGGRMLLTSTRAVSEPFAFTTSGLQLQPWITGDGSIGVDGVYRGSPAERAGFAAGDRLLAVDGRPVSELGIDETRALLSGAPGTRVQLRVVKAGATREVELELAQVLD